MFSDRQEAGRRLGERLLRIPLKNPVVLGIPRGGIVTGAAVADVLSAELDVVLAHKLGAPGQPELAIGAVGEDGNVYLDRELELLLGVDQDYLEQERARQWAQLQRRSQMFRKVRPAASLEGRSAIITDDGIATGSTVLAAIETVKAQQPAKIIVAVPVIPAQRVDFFTSRCDRLVFLEAPVDFTAVGQFYRVFDSVPDEDVLHLLSKGRPGAPQTVS